MAMFNVSKKAKNAGVSLAFVLSALAPLKATAQHRVYDWFASRMSVAMDTVRPGTTVKCTSSAHKIITIENGPNTRMIYNPHFKGQKNNIMFRRNTIQNIMPKETISGTSARFKQGADKHGPYYTLVRGNLRQIKDKKYEYNTDAMYDKYLALAKNTFPNMKRIPPRFLKINVYCVEMFDQVNIYDMRSGGNGRLVGSMVIDFETGDVVQQSTRYEIFVYQHDLVGLYAVRMYDGKKDLTYELSYDRYENRITPAFEIAQAQHKKRSR